MSQILERFEAAVRALVDDGPVKQRLGLAYSRHLEDLQQIDLPVAGKGGFNDLHAALHGVPPMGNVGSVQASIRKMSSAEAVRHARTIVRIYAELLVIQAGPKALAEPPAKLGEGPPRYLVGGN
jgi:hypothetical protein